MPLWAIWIFLHIPLPASFFDTSQNTVFLDRNGQEIATEFSSENDENRRHVSLSEVSPFVLQAVVAAEDQNFLGHSGVDLSATLRAIRDNILLGKIVSGASTLSQQVARQYLGIERKRTFLNKIEETLWAWRLETQFSKAEILEEWLNRVSFSGNIVGIAAATENIFGKSAAHLDLAEASFLAGIPQSPTRFAPFQNFEKTKERQNFVLERMAALGFISNNEKTTAEQEVLIVKKRENANPAFHFLQWIKTKRSLVSAKKIRTTLDLSLQKTVNALVEFHLQKLSNNNTHNAAALVWDTDTGEILAFVGNTDFRKKDVAGEVNILAAPRSVGSALKPFLYLLAFSELGWTPEQTIQDEPTAFGTGSGFLYEPQNYDLNFRGTITVRQALAESRNVPAVATLQQLGSIAFFSFLEKLGVDTQVARENDFGLSAALGSFPIAPLELAHAYGVLARGGKDFRWQFLLPLQNAFNGSQIADCHNAVEIIDILSDENARINSFGTKNPLRFPYAVAVKTGTSRNFEDNWTVGFSDQIGVLAWVGNADGSAMQNVSGISGAGPLFAAVMNEAMKTRTKAKNFSLDKLCADAIKEADTVQNLPAEKNTKFSILRPLSGQKFFLSTERPLSAQKLEFRATEESIWFVNNEQIGIGKSVFWQPKAGEFTITAQTNMEQTTVHISVQ